MRYQINDEIVRDIVKSVLSDESRKQTLEKALYRNHILTSEYDLNFVKLSIYKEGFYLTLEGTRCDYKIFAKDNDGDLELTRKPNESKLHLIYEDFGKSDDMNLKELWLA